PRDPTAVEGWCRRGTKRYGLLEGERVARGRFGRGRTPHGLERNDDESVAARLEARRGNEDLQLLPLRWPHHHSRQHRAASSVLDVATVVGIGARGPWAQRQAHPALPGPHGEDGRLALGDRQEVRGGRLDGRRTLAAGGAPTPQSQRLVSGNADEDGRRDQRALGDGPEELPEPSGFRFRAGVLRVGRA